MSFVHLLVICGAALPVAELIGMTDVHSRGHHGRVDLDAFVRDGYVAVRGAVDAGTVAACRELIWTAMERRGVRRDNPGSWPRSWRA